MQLLNLFILLSFLLLYSSCNIQKETQVESSYTSNLDSSSQASTLSLSQIVSLLNTTTDIDITGITLEFFPPDSLHPDGRASPKKLSIDKADIKNTSESTEVATVETISAETENLHHDSSGDTKQDTHQHGTIGIPLSEKIIFGVLLLIIIIFSVRKAYSMWYARPPS